MLAKTAKAFLLVSLSIYFLKWLFFWLYETNDSYFYYAFAEFMKSGKYFVPHPYYWTIPSTLEPPLYSVFLYLAQFSGRAEIVIHLVQIAAILFSGFAVYQIIKTYIRKSIALTVTSIYLLIPANFFQSSSLMAESLAIFSVSLYIYLVFLIIAQKKEHLTKYLILFSAIIILVRYNFISLFFLSLLFLATKKKALILNSFFVFLGFLVIAGWILVNHQLNGSWGLSDQMGKNLYNRVVGGDRLVPSADDKNWLRLKEMVGEKFDLFQPTYNIEPLIISNFESVVSESQFFASIAAAALIKNPLSYLTNTFFNFFIIHKNGLPYPDNLYTYGRYMGGACETLGTIYLCQPIIKNYYAAPIWNFLVKYSEIYYSFLPGLINFFLLFPAILFALIQKKPFFRFAAILYIIEVITIIIPEIPVIRYIYPLFPIKVILITYLITQVIQFRNKILTGAV